MWALVFAVGDQLKDTMASQALKGIGFPYSLNCLVAFAEPTATCCQRVTAATTASLSLSLSLQYSFGRHALSRDRT